jgi:L-asparaginase
VRIGLLATGGTIVSAAERGTGTVRPSLRVEWLVNHTGLPAELEFAYVEEHLRVDSCDLTPHQMLGIARRTRDGLRERELDGLVVTHGSDALEETSFLCDLLVDGDQVIVFTAAMRLPGDPAADGGRNLAAAARLARDPGARGLGALILAGDEIHAARWARKQDSFRVNSMTSPGRGAVGAVTPSGVQLWRGLPHRISLPFPDALPASVPVLQSFSGMTAEYIRSLIRVSAAEGIVIEGSGLGNIPAAAIPAVREAIEAGVVVAVTSRALTGGVHGVYRGGRGAGALRDAGAVLAGDVATNKARLLVLLALALSENHAEARELLAAAIAAVDGHRAPPPFKPLRRGNAA